MSQTQAGWYPDPTMPPTDPPHFRYWDGSGWTEHTAAPPAHTVAVPSTPDGVPLAGWWWRVLAYVIDSCIVGVPAIAVAIPDFARIVRLASDQAWESDDAGYSSATFEHRYADAFHSVTLHQLPIAVLALVYFAVMLRWKGATLGHLAAGLRVRLRDVPGQLPWSAIGLRVLVLYGIRIVPTLVVVVGLGVVGVPLGWLVSLFGLLNLLWPLWDGKRQALHDKAARTNVVKVR